MITGHGGGDGKHNVIDGDGGLDSEMVVMVAVVVTRAMVRIYDDGQGGKGECSTDRGDGGDGLDSSAFG